ncbi:helix-turn-helix domain-containing protein [Streptomyces sp. NPDC057579]|uniref:helix-turn-helix domain-containing protein n=1 Tax=Streptomyces sp. NPDC057579 TaxID=3346172 RepID=UPI003692223A
MVASAKSEVRAALRARIVLAATDGVANGAIAREPKFSVNTVRKWRGRFAALGPDGLREAERSGRPKTYGPEVRVATVATATSMPPHPEATWSHASAGLVRALRLSAGAPALSGVATRSYRRRLPRRPASVRARSAGSDSSRMGPAADRLIRNADTPGRRSGPGLHSWSGMSRAGFEPTISRGLCPMDERGRQLPVMGVRDFSPGPLARPTWVRTQLRSGLADRRVARTLTLTDPGWKSPPSPAWAASSAVMNLSNIDMPL